MSQLYQASPVNVTDVHNSAVQYSHIQKNKVLCNVMLGD